MVKIAIDAGHGSQTAGKRTPDGYREHWINVKAAYYCEQYLSAHGFGTLKTGWNDINALDDVDTPLTIRQRTIKNAKCDYSISFHANASGNGTNYNNGAGVETYYHSNENRRGDSVNFAQYIQKELVKGTTQIDRGIKSSDLAMCDCYLTGTKAACLVEIGFMTNKREADLMKTDSFCKEQGEDAAKGIIEYLRSKGIVGKDYSAVFDATYYSNKYADLKKAFGNDKDKLLEHFIANGMKEGRQGSAEFDVAFYKNKYEDLRKAFGNDNVSYYNHYMISGKKEGRVGADPACCNGINYSAVFNYDYYKAKYEDLRKAFGNDYRAYINHFITNGMKEGRQASEEFNLEVYKSKYEDLRKAFGNNNKSYYMHYITNGKKEGRNGKQV